MSLAARRQKPASAGAFLPVLVAVLPLAVLPACSVGGEALATMALTSAAGLTYQRSERAEDLRRNAYMDQCPHVNRMTCWDEWRSGSRDGNGAPAVHRAAL